MDRPKLPSSLFSVASILLLTTPSILAACFFPDGSRSDRYQPCSQIRGSISMCCATNRSNPPGGPDSNGLTADICLENGLCQNIVRRSNGDVIYSYWRDLCSSVDWPTNGCLSVCTQGKDYSGTPQLTPCENTPYSRTWCCGMNNTACCGTSDAVTLAPTLGVGTSSSLNTPSSSVTKTASSATTVGSQTQTRSPEQSQPQTSSSSSLSTGAKAGIGIGVGVGSLAVFGVLAACLIRWQLRKSSSRSMVQGSYSGSGVMSRGQLQEKPGDAPIPRYELAGRSVVEAGGR